MLESVSRQSLKDFTQLNLDLSTRKRATEPEMAKRTSARIMFRKKLKSMSNSSLPPREESDDTSIEMIEPHNPEHKLLFLKLLGLEPKSIVPDNKKCIEKYPVVQLERLPHIYSVKVPLASNLEQVTDTDNDDDLDLDVMFCPLDIPEIYEEITKKPFPICTSTIPSNLIDSALTLTDTKINYGTSESGYDSSTCSPTTTPDTKFSSPNIRLAFNIPSKSLNFEPEKSFQLTSTQVPICHNKPPSIYDDTDDCIIIDRISSGSPFNFKTIKRTNLTPIKRRVKCSRVVHKSDDDDDDDDDCKIIQASWKSHRQHQNHVNNLQESKKKRMQQVSRINMMEFTRLLARRLFKK